MRTGAGKKGRIIVGLDVGTTKICCIVSALTDEGAIDVIGLAVSPSRGLRKGVVVNIESTVESIKKAVEEMFELVGREIRQAGHESTVVAGLVLSGGTALLPGIVDVAERVLE